MATRATHTDTTPLPNGPRSSEPKWHSPINNGLSSVHPTGAITSVAALGSKT